MVTNTEFQQNTQRDIVEIKTTRKIIEDHIAQLESKCERLDSAISMLKEQSAVHKELLCRIENELSSLENIVDSYRGKIDQNYNMLDKIYNNILSCPENSALYHQLDNLDAYQQVVDYVYQDTEYDVENIEKHNTQKEHTKDKSGGGIIGTIFDNISKILAMLIGIVTLLISNDVISF